MVRRKRYVLDTLSLAEKEIEEASVIIGQRLVMSTFRMLMHSVMAFLILAIVLSEFSSIPLHLCVSQLLPSSV